MSAQQRAIALLARREHSQKELRQKLLQRGHSTEEIDAALQRLAETGLQCEERYAQSLARTRVGAGHGPRRIRNDLRQQGFGEEGIEAAMSASSQDWPSLAVEALQRRFGQASGSQDAMDRNSVMKLRSRQLAFLLRRGFDAETARIAQSRWERGD
ncbi:MAG: regulatory protein RecX [Lysobacteraceae bacterium]